MKRIIDFFKRIFGCKKRKEPVFTQKQQQLTFELLKQGMTLTNAYMSETYGIKSFGKVMSRLRETLRAQGCAYVVADRNVVGLNDEGVKCHWKEYWLEKTVFNNEQ